MNGSRRTENRTGDITRYYGSRRNARDYEKIRFGNPGGAMVDLREKTIIQDLLGNHPKSLPVLEIGPGSGRFALMLARAGYHVVCVDRSREMLAIISQSAESENLDIQCIEADMFSLPFADRSFATVYSIRVLWHFSNYGDALRELARVADGTVIFDMMNRWSLASLTAAVANRLTHRQLHTAVASRREIHAHVQAAGLEIALHRQDFVFPYIIYRKLPWFRQWLASADRQLARHFGIGSVLYYRLQRPGRE